MAKAIYVDFSRRLTGEHWFKGAADMRRVFEDLRLEGLWLKGLWLEALGFESMGLEGVCFAGM